MREAPDLEPLLAEVRRRDPERTLCALFASPAARPALLALLLLDHEVARVAERVRQPLAGLIRLRFWRDQLAAAGAGAPCDHPLARALGPPLREGRLDPAELEGLVAAREAELDSLVEPGAAPPGPPPDLDTVVDHVHATGGALARLWARLLGSPPSACAAAEAAGTAWGLVAIVRAAPIEAGRVPRIRLRSLLDLAGLEPPALGSEDGGARLRAAAAALLDRAEVAIGEARAVGRVADRAGLAPLLQATVAEARLRALRRAGCDPFRAHGPEGVPLLPLRLLLAWYRRRP